MIAKIKELTAPKLKYQVRDKVFCVAMNGEVSECEVLERSVYDNGEYLVEFPDHYRAIFTEDRMFPTKEQLFNFQIDYWTDLKIKEISTRSDAVSLIDRTDDE